MGYPAEISVDLDALVSNLDRMRDYAKGAEILAVVKANGYGLGRKEIATTLWKNGVRWFGVARVPEALLLKRELDEAGADSEDVRILTWLNDVRENWDEALRNDLDVSVSTQFQLDEITKSVARLRANGEKQNAARIHLKVDVGMSRAGATLADLPDLAQAVSRAERAGEVQLVGLWSHLSQADDPNGAGREETSRQIETFKQADALVGELGLSPALRHLEATSGAIWFPEAHFDMVRIGLGLYGLSPNPDVATSADLGLRPIARMTTKIAQVKRLSAGTQVSYGGTWQASEDRWVGLLPVGYADGISRALSNKDVFTVQAGSRTFPTAVLGRVCMDQTVIDLGGEEQPKAEVGDTAVLLGDPTSGELGADRWAELTGTINYDVIAGLPTHLKRVYLERPLDIEITVSSANETRELGAALAKVLTAGDVLVLIGDLGAGKTTFVQGLGRGLDVAGRITSPTYIVSRVHAGKANGPGLVHVDAYRVEDELDLETIDLETGLDESVTVIEWGQGKVEHLSENRLEIEFAFDGPLPAGNPPEQDKQSGEGAAGDEGRRISIRPVGPEMERRFASMDVAGYRKQLGERTKGDTLR